MKTKTNDACNTEFIRLTINLPEAAEFLGFKSTERLRQKAKQGAIPGAFKIGKYWKFYKPKLVEYVSELYATYCKTVQVGISGGNLCQSAKKMVVHTTTQDSLSAVSEYKNLREQLLNQKHNATKKNAEEK